MQSKYKSIVPYNVISIILTLLFNWNNLYPLISCQTKEYLNGVYIYAVHVYIVFHFQEHKFF